MFALIDVFRAVKSLVARCAGAGVGAVDGAGVTDGVSVAGIGCARVIEVAEKTSLPRRALAVKRPNPVDAGGAVEASCACAVVDVDRAFWTSPAVDADAGETADGVGARCSVLAD